MGKVFYLGKDGRSVGPLSEETLSQMHKDGSIASYSWIWDDSLKAWQPLAARPPVPVTVSVGTEIDVIAQSFVQEPKDRTDGLHVDALDGLDPERDVQPGIEALIFNCKHFVRGEVLEISGQQLLATAPWGSFCFGRGVRVRLMVYRAQSGESEVVEARVVAFKKMGRSWLYTCELEQSLVGWQGKDAA